LLNIFAFPLLKKLLDPSTQIVYVVVYDSRLQIDLHIASSLWHMFEILFSDNL